MYKLGEMVEDRFKGLKYWNESKKGLHGMTLQLEGPKMELEGLKEEKEQDSKKRA